ncbi:MAG TPA: Gfo/Idh/MocA family oxidoreductase [Verrucomicrobiota bacterium]|jgi:predicted dehydrogenase|nr:Gfo/Idh/MocA family oxidoreductase [Verrucomicrobiota bacterium]HQL77213.1 Gfo/Idh/MocA family oxidoreductase [Verrucomicrobiota bacterium]
MNQPLSVSRRQFLKASLAMTTGAAVFPTIVPASVLGAGAPSKKIQVGQIGCGRIALTMDLPGIIKHDIARVVAVCDLDSKRLAHARKYVEGAYAKKQGGGQAVAVKTYGNYRELLKDPQIDAVAISTPDHWHSEPVIAAALAGKDVYVQKPLTMTLREGRAVSDILRARKRAFQIGSQQRSTAQFRIACELVRNGRIGQLRTVKIGLPVDPAGGNDQEMPVPPNLDYEQWLGCTPKVPYTEERVHPQNSITDRPGWLRIDSYCLGMITGWGSHHVDIAHWGMGAELTGPILVEGKAEFPTKGLWNVHGPYHIEAQYVNGVTMIIDNNFTNGVKFEGDKGWIFVSRGGAKATASDPASAFGKALDASDPAILNAKIAPNEIHLHKSEDHHLDWLQSIQTRQPAVTTPEEAHRSTSACILGWIAMKLGRKLRWDPHKEAFAGDDQANAMLTRAERAPYGIDRLLKKP